MFIMRKSDSADVGLGEDYEDDLADVGCNAELYIVNQESTDLLREVYTGYGGRTGTRPRFRFSFMGHPGPISLSVSVA